MNKGKWSDQYPHWMELSHIQGPQKNRYHWQSSFWTIFFRRKFYSLSIFGFSCAAAKSAENNVNELNPSIWFQHECAPQHFDINVINFLHDPFPHRWIGMRREVEWPARSPGFASWEFFLFTKAWKLGRLEKHSLRN